MKNARGGFNVGLFFLDNLGRVTPSASWSDSATIHNSRHAFPQQIFFLHAL